MMVPGSPVAPDEAACSNTAASASSSLPTQLILPYNNQDDDYDDYQEDPMFARLFQMFRKSYIKANQSYKSRVMDRCVAFLQQENIQVFTQQGDLIESLPQVHEILLDTFSKNEERMRSLERTMTSSNSPQKKKAANRKSATTTTTTSSNASTSSNKKPKPSPPLAPTTMTTTATAETTTTSSSRARRLGRRIRKPAKHKFDDFGYDDEEDDHSQDETESKQWRLYRAPPREHKDDALERYARVFGHTRIVPGWVGDTELSDYMSWQRQMARERACGYHLVPQAVVATQNTSIKTQQQLKASLKLNSDDNPNHPPLWRVVLDDDDYLEPKHGFVFV